MERRRRNINLELLRRIQELNFAIVDIVLYLNTHPEDRDALRLHNELSQNYHQLVEEYQRRYGQLYANYPDADYPWPYVNDPWPWEIDY